MVEELCEAEDLEAYQRTNNFVDVFAYGVHPYEGFKVVLKEAVTPTGTFPPEFNLVHTPPLELPSERKETGFFARTAFFNDHYPVSIVRHVTVYDRLGSHQVRVEQPDPPERPDPRDRPNS